MEAFIIGCVWHSMEGREAAAEVGGERLEAGSWRLEAEGHGTTTSGKWIVSLNEDRIR
jgi:hypothetical protein